MRQKHKADTLFSKW